VIVVLVVLEVFGQVGNALGQDRDLDFGRPGVAFLDPVFLDEFGFSFRRDLHRGLLI